MKLGAFFILIFSSHFFGFSQASVFDSLLNLGKLEFNKEFDLQDYDYAAEVLEKALELNPDHPELLYFLGYTFSRLNSKDGNTIIETDAKMVEISSGYFEKIIKIQLKYQGQMLALDPYSKIAAEWSSLALNYCYYNDIASAESACREGKTRGGLGEYLLELARLTLNECNENAIFISSGDNITFPLLYLQSIEKYRTDVTIVDVNMLNTNWYPSYLHHNYQLEFGMNIETLDTINYLEWHDSTIAIDQFSWDLTQGSFNGFLSRGDQILLSLIKENLFKRDIYLSPFMYSENKLNLHAALVPHPLAERILINHSEFTFHQEFATAIEAILRASHLINQNSQDQMSLLDHFRYAMMIRIMSIPDPGSDNDARHLFYMLEDYCPDYKFPFTQSNGKEYYDYMKSQF